MPWGKATNYLEADWTKMLGMTVDDICKQLVNNNKMNFIGVAITVLQANGIDACIKSFNAKGIELNGFVLLPPHHQTGRALTEQSFCNINSNIAVCEFEYKQHTEKHAPVKNRIHAMCSAVQATYIILSFVL